MRFGRIAFGGLFALLSIGCTTRSILVLTDPYWTLELRSENGAAEIEAAAGRAGYAVDLQNIDPAGNVERQMAALLLKSKASAVIMSPLLSQHAAALAELHPDRRFFAFGSPTASMPPNLTELVSDPRDAFYEAGVKAGRYLKRLSSARGTQLALCGLFAVVPEIRLEAMQRFVEGFTSVDGAPFYRLEVRDPADRNAVRIFLNDMKLKAPGLYVIAAPTVAGYCLDLLKDDPTPLVVENWPAALSGDPRIALSIDEESLPSLVKVVETLGRSADNRMRIPWRVVASAAAAR